MKILDFGEDKYIKNCETSTDQLSNLIKVRNLKRSKEIVNQKKMFRMEIPMSFDEGRSKEDVTVVLKERAILPAALCEEYDILPAGSSLDREACESGKGRDKAGSKDLQLEDAERTRESVSTRDFKRD